MKYNYSVRNVVLPGCLLAAAVVAGAALRPQHSAPVTRGDALLRSQLEVPEEGVPLVLHGQIVAEPERRSRSTVRLLVKTDSVRLATQEEWMPAGERVQVDIYTRGCRGRKGDIERDLPWITHPGAYGYRIETTVRVRRPRTPHGQSRFCGHWKGTKLLERSSGNRLFEAILAMKYRMLCDYRRRFPDAVYCLAAGAALGERGPSRMGFFRRRSMTALFRHSGIGHVLAVSGLHVGVLAAGVIGLLRRLRAAPVLLLLVLAGVLGSYTVMTGARPSTMRATLMALTGVGMHALTGRGVRHSAWIATAVSAAVLLVWTPDLIFDVGFQLSYGAVLSLLLLTRPVGRALTRLGPTGGLTLLTLLVISAVAVQFCAPVTWSPRGLMPLLLLWLCVLRCAALLDRRMWPRLRPTLRLPQPVKALLAAQFAIQLGMVLPLGSLYFGQVSLAGTVVNLLAIPLIAVFVQATLLTGVLSLIPMVGGLLAWLPGKVATLSGMAFFEVAYAGARVFPFPSVPQPSPALLLIWYAAIALIFFGPRPLAAITVSLASRIPRCTHLSTTKEAKA